MESFQPDVLIIGAGVAGLAAAGKLSQAGLRVLVLEARERLGGRVLTIHPENLEVAVELGAEFVHGRSPQTFELIKSGGLEAGQVAGAPFFWKGQALGRWDFWGPTDKALDGMQKEGYPAQAFDSVLKKPHKPAITKY